MKKSIRTKVTIEEAFELGRREGLKEAFTEISKMVTVGVRDIRVYIEARLKSIHDFNSNPFKKD